MQVAVLRPAVDGSADLDEKQDEDPCQDDVEVEEGEGEGVLVGGEHDEEPGDETRYKGRVMGLKGLTVKQVCSRRQKSQIDSWIGMPAMTGEWVIDVLYYIYYDVNIKSSLLVLTPSKYDPVDFFSSGSVKLTKQN